MVEEVPTAVTICCTRPVEVKVKMYEAFVFTGAKRNEAVKSRRKRGKQ
jgi:hypothetical protein